MTVRTPVLLSRHELATTELFSDRFGVLSGSLPRFALRLVPGSLVAWLLVGQLGQLWAHPLDQGSVVEVWDSPGRQRDCPSTVAG